MEAEPTIITIADLRDLLDLPEHAINHALKRYGPPPRGRLGIMRYWSREDLGQIRRATMKTQAVRRRREGVARGA